MRECFQHKTLRIKTNSNDFTKCCAVIGKCCKLVCSAFSLVHISLSNNLVDPAYVEF